MIGLLRAGNGMTTGRTEGDAPRRRFIDDRRRRTTGARQAIDRRERLLQPAILDAARIDGLDGVQE